MTKRTKKSKTPPTIAVIIALIIAVITALQQSRQPTSPTVTTQLVTQMGLVTSTAAPKPQIAPATVSSSTSVPLSTRKPIATDIPGLQVTPINGVLYEVVASTSALGCPNSRCKVIEKYTKDNILVVTGSVIGTTYKDKKTKIWYEVIAHDGRKVYVHEAFVKPHES